MAEDVHALITKRIAERISEKGLQVPALTPETSILGGQLPLDLLDVATILVELVDDVGEDPFADGLVQFHTIGDLTDIFRKQLCRTK